MTQLFIFCLNMNLLQLSWMLVSVVGRGDEMEVFQKGGFDNIFGDSPVKSTPFSLYSTQLSLNNYLTNNRQQVHLNDFQNFEKRLNQVKPDRERADQLPTSSLEDLARIFRREQEVVMLVNN